MLECSHVLKDSDLPNSSPIVVALLLDLSEVRMWLSLIAYNLGNQWRRLAVPAPAG